MQSDIFIHEKSLTIKGRMIGHTSHNNTLMFWDGHSLSVCLTPQQGGLGCKCWKDRPVYKPGNWCISSTTIIPVDNIDE